MCDRDNNKTYMNVMQILYSLNRMDKIERLYTSFSLVF